MKVAELFEYVDEILENAFTDKTKRRWLNQIEAEIQVDVLLTAADGVIQYGEGDNDAELIAPPPYDQLYHEYLFWQICLAQQEVERANNYAATFNRAYNEYVRFVAETINPGCGMAERLRYYLTAYQIAVKHGYVGSEEEWVESLKGYKGEDGKPGAGLHILGQVETEEDLPTEDLESGVGYLVGTGTDALLYIWDAEKTDWFYKQPLGTQGPQGNPGVSPTISVIEIAGGHRLTITDANGSKTVDIMDGEVGKTGAPGQIGQTGAPGDPGKDGVSPTLAITNITGGHRLTIKDAAGTKTVDILDGSDGRDGVSPTITTKTITGGYRLTITDAIGTKSIDLMNGSDGKDGDEGANGVDGISPILSVTSIPGGHRIAITDAVGTKTVDVLDGQDGAPGAAGKDGVDGRGVQKIERTSGTGAAGSSDTYTITYTDNTTTRFTVYNGADGTSFVVKDRYATLAALKAAHASGSEGEAYAVGTESENIIYIWGVDTGDWTPIGSLQGPQGIAGEDGRAAEFRASGGYLQWRLVGDTSWTNLLPLADITGPAGSDGDAGAAGKDGVSPTVSVQKITGGHRLTITDATGSKTVDILDGATGQTGATGDPGAAGQDGVSPTVSISTIEGGHRISVTDAGGTKTFDVMDGADGKSGADGSPGAAGKDGVSPVASVTAISGGHRLSITDANGTKNVDIMDGTDGKDGQDGYTPQKGVDYVDGEDGTSVTVASVSESTEDGGTNVVTFSDGKKLNVKNGSKGGDGAPGATGAPGRGVKKMEYNAAANNWTVTYTDNTTETVAGPSIPSGSWNDLTDKPSTFPPSAHTQAASTITAGTFAGQVKANASGQAPGVYCQRNQKVSLTAENPTVNGEICWLAE